MLLLIESSLDTDSQVKTMFNVPNCLISSDSESFYRRLTILSPTFTFPNLLLNCLMLHGRLWCCCWGSLPSELEPLPRAFADAAAPTHGRHLSSYWLDIRRQMLNVRCAGMTVQVYISMLDSEHQPSEYLYPCWVGLTGFDGSILITFKLSSAPSWPWDAWNSFLHVLL